MKTDTALETIFTHSGVGYVGGRPFNGDFDPDSYEGVVNEMIMDAVDFEQSYLAPVRESHQRYYDGLEPRLETREEGEDEEQTAGRSTFVSTDVRDTILAILPSLIRIFMSTDERVAEFEPRTEAEQGVAEQIFDYLNYVFFNDNEGFLILYAVLKDTLTLRGGITKWWTDNDYEIEERTFQNITQEQRQYIIYEVENLEVIGEEPADPNTGIIPRFSVRYQKSKPINKVVAVPPDEFRVSRDATSLQTAKLVGHEYIASRSDLIKKGISPDELDYYTARNVIQYSNERYLRNPGLADDRGSVGIPYGEFYIRIDGDGDGIEELRYICTVGDDHHIVYDEIVPNVRFAYWSCDPRPHTLVGDCITDLIKDIQRIKTNMQRGQIDNLAESLNPRSVVNTLVTNMEDVLSDEIGAIIRTTGSPSDAVAYTKTPYSGADVQVTIDYLDKVRASRTGITEASRGLDPRAMQSTTLTGIDAIISGAQERIELIARVIAETGFKDTFHGLLREVVDNPNQIRTVKLRGQWVEVNPSTFDPTMRMQVNPTLGKGTDTMRMQALIAVEQAQVMILQQFGVANPMVTPIEYRNTQVDKLRIANIKNPSRYFKDIDPNTMQQIMSAPKEPTAEELLAKAQIEDVKSKTSIAIQKANQQEAELQERIRKDAADEDFRRDKLNVEASLEVAKMAQDSLKEPAGLSDLNSLEK